MKFQKKTNVVVEAVQWLNRAIVCPPGPEWLAEAQQKRIIELAGDELCVNSDKRGMQRARPGDWIIRDATGDIYPMRPDVFAETYELAEAAK